MKKELFNLKNILVFVGIVVVIGAIIVLAVFNPFKTKKDNEPKNNSETNKVEKINTKDDLISVINSTMAEYYEKYYYPENTKEDVKNLSEFGINYSLDSVIKVMLPTEDFQNNLTKYECDLENTKARVYPKDPFGAEDYKIDVDIKCNK